MARVICIDYGGKRTGIAVTDPLKIIATALTTIDTSNFMAFLKKYFSENEVERILIGEPKNWDDSDTHATPLVQKAIQALQKQFPQIPIEKVDERYTSRMASQAMVQMGMKKKNRQKKGNIDQIAATIMLQEWIQKQ